MCLAHKYLHPTRWADIVYVEVPQQWRNIAFVYFQLGPLECVCREHVVAESVLRIPEALYRIERVRVPKADFHKFVLFACRKPV